MRLIIVQLARESLEEPTWILLKQFKLIFSLAGLIPINLPCQILDQRPINLQLWYHCHHVLSYQTFSNITSSLISVRILTISQIVKLGKGHSKFQLEIISDQLNLIELDIFEFNNFCYQDTNALFICLKNSRKTQGTHE